MDNDWIEWHGGECPVDPDTVADVVLGNGEEFTETAVNLRWSIRHYPDNIMRYRVHIDTPPSPSNPEPSLDGYSRMSDSELADIAFPELDREGKAIGYRCWRTGNSEILIEIDQVVIRYYDEDYYFYNFECQIEWEYGEVKIEIEGDNKHPHVLKKKFCLDFNRGILGDYISQYKYVDFVAHLAVTLSTYTPSSRYRALGEVFKCSSCDDEFSEDEARSCYMCRDNLCGYCSYTCHHCEESFCSDHIVKCSMCNNHFCQRHIQEDMCSSCHENYEECESCHAIIYIDDTIFCEECDDVHCSACYNGTMDMCNDCAEEHGVCEECDAIYPKAELWECPRCHLSYCTECDDVTSEMCATCLEQIKKFGKREPEDFGYTQIDIPF